MPQSHPSVSQLRPGEGVARLQFQAFLPSEEQQLSVGGALDQVEDQALRRAVGVRHLQQRVGQRRPTGDGNQQRAVDVQDGWVAVGCEESKEAKYEVVKLCGENNWRVLIGRTYGSEQFVYESIAV